MILKVAKLFLYLSLVLLVFLMKGEDFFKTYSIFCSQYYYLESSQFVFYNIFMFLALFVYVFVLVRSTIDGGHMPLWSHLIPIFFLSIVLNDRNAIKYPKFLGEEKSSKILPADRSMYAMLNIKNNWDYFVCKDFKNFNFGELETYLEEAAGEYRWSGYRTYGILKEFDFIIERGNKAITDFSRLLDSQVHPGSIFFVYSMERKTFWMTAVIADAIPTGSASFVVDSLGRPVVITSSCEE